MEKNCAHASHALAMIRIPGILLLLLMSAFLCGCVVDADYAGVVAAARTDCKANDIVGIWTCSSPVLAQGAIKAIVLQIRPDGTGFQKYIYVDTGRTSDTHQLLWHYDGNGVWSAEDAKIQYSGNALAWTQAWKLVFIRSDGSMFQEPAKTDEAAKKSS